MEDIKFTEGLVRQAGYEEGRCKFVKLDENKTYYLVEDIEIGNDMYVVTPSVSEALKRTERKTVGIIDANGKVLVPCVNSNVAPINDMFIGVSRETLSDEETRESIRAKIKRDLDGDIEFIIDDKSKYDIYKISEGSLELIYEGAVFVVESDGNILVQSEDANDKLVAIYENETKKETINESKPQMPVETFAKVNEKMTDSLEVPEMEEQKEGAPELRDEEIGESTTEVVDDIEFEPSKKEEKEEKEEEKEEKQSDYFQISDIKNVSSIFEKKEPTPSEDEFEESAEIEVEEKAEKEVDVKESSEIKEQMADIASLITAARNKVDGLEKDNDEKENKIKELSSEIKNLEGEITSLNDDKIKQRKIIEEQKEVTEEQNRRITSLTSENKSLKENNVELTNKNKQLQSDKEELKNKISSLEKTLEQVYGEVYDAFSGFRSEDNKSYKKVA